MRHQLTAHNQILITASASGSVTARSERSRTRSYSWRSTESLDVRSPVATAECRLVTQISSSMPKTRREPLMSMTFSKELAGGGTRPFPRTETAAHGDRINRFRPNQFRSRAQGWVTSLLAAARPHRQRYCQGAEFVGAAYAPADISTLPPAGLSGTTPVAPVVDAQAVEGLASQAGANYRSVTRSKGVRVAGGQIAS